MTEGSGERGKNRRVRKKGRPGKRRRRAEPSQRQRRGPDRHRVLRKAVSHPLRRRMLQLMREEDVALSAAQLAERLDVPLGFAAYHAAVLRRCGATSASSAKDG